MEEDLVLVTASPPLGHALLCSGQCPVLTSQPRLSREQSRHSPLPARRDPSARVISPEMIDEVAPEFVSLSHLHVLAQMTSFLVWDVLPTAEMGCRG